MSAKIRHAAVIGSGTMGGAIAAHLANVGIPVDLFDIIPHSLTPEEEAKGLTLESPQVRNRIVNAGWQAQLKASPAALYHPNKAEWVRLGNLEDHFDRLAEADWIIEVIVENLAIKHSLMEKLDAIRKPHTVIATNTSGLSIRAIAEGRSESFRQHFLGMHFFNPPRYLNLLEIIPHSDTSSEVLEAMTRFGEDELGKGVVVCKDTPNFIGNRLLSISGAFELGYAIANNYTVDEVDAIMGPLVGRPRTAVFRLLDLIGIDVMAHVNENLYPALDEDERRELLTDPGVVDLIQHMVNKGSFGNKSGKGFYKRVDTNGKKEFWPIDLQTKEYIPPEKVRFESVGANRKIEPVGARLKAMVQAEDRAGEYVRMTLYNRLAYASMRLGEITDDIISLDRAIKWGFAHQLGPFEEWDAIGVAESLPEMLELNFPVAPWVQEMLDTGCDTFYTYQDGLAVAYYDPNVKTYVAIESNPRKLRVKSLKAQGKVVAESADAYVIDLGDGIALFEWHSKANTITLDMMAMGRRAIEIAESDFDGLVITHDGEGMFSAGANLDMMAIQQMATDQGVTPADIVDNMAKEMQQLHLAYRYAQVPVVVAPFGRALGGGAELTMAGDRIVAHAELYIGQTEFAVGLLPAAGGCKELLRRVVNPVMRNPNADVLPVMQQVFETVGFAKVSLSAYEAIDLGFIGPADRIVVNRDYLLSEAKREARHMADSGYRPPHPEKIYAAGRDILSAMQTQLWMMRDAGYISEHDQLIGNKIAWVLCGGDLSAPTWVDEQYILDLERVAFVELVQEPKSIERIFHTLKTGKPLRN